MSQMEPVAFDLETTGLHASDHVTVAGFALPMGTRLHLNVAGRDVDPGPLEEDLDGTGGAVVQVRTHADEAVLLDALQSFVEESIATREYFLTAFNGECWRGGFDLPFLRTRLRAHETAWPFTDVPYADLQPIYDRQFHTDRPAGSAADLDGIATLVLGGELTDLDPFEDSAAAVTAFERGQFRDLLLHNLVDVLRTARLARVAQRYCSRSDFDLKSLTPAARRPGAK